jgi:hypothetical protein
MISTGNRHERLYRSLLRAFPARYRSAYGEQMVQLFGDQLRRDGAAATWLRAIGELPATATTEHLRRNGAVAQSLSIPPTPASRLLGILGVVAGALILVGFLGLLGLNLSPDLFNLRLVFYNVGVIAVVIAVHRRQSSSGRRLALSAAILAVLSNVAYMLVILRVVAQPGEVGPGDYQPIILTTAVTAAMWLSDAWFGAVTLKLGVLNRWSASGLIVGSVAAFAGMGNWGLAGATLLGDLLLVGIGIHGLAWILLGLEVALRGTRVVAQPTG